MSIGGGMRYRADGRTPGQMRPVSVEMDVQKWATASLIYRQGDTHVLCSATVEDRVPPFLRGKGTGWVTAEYAMLPTATSERMQRESVRGKLGGRTYEIQRLVGRSLRGAVDTSVIGERTVTVDCDVIQADGGTRCASITGGFLVLSPGIAQGQPRAGHRRQDRGHQRRHRRRYAAPRPRVHRGLRGRGRLQRRRHGRRRVHRGPGDRRGQSLRPCVRWTVCWVSPTTVWAGSSRSRTRCSRATAHDASPPAGDTLAAQDGRTRRRCWRCPVSNWCRPTMWASRVSRSRTLKPSRPTPRSRRASTPVARVCPHWPMTRASRSTRSTGGPGVYTKRYAGEDASDDDNNRKLLACPRWPTRRTTRCSLHLRAWPSSIRGSAEVIFSTGTFDGRITDGARVARVVSATTPSSSRSMSRSRAAPWPR